MRQPEGAGGLSLPNRVTMVRLGLAPVLLSLLFLGAPERPGLRGLMLALFAACVVSDALDGWMARRLNQRTRLGALLDPIADKGLYLSLLVALLLLPSIPPSMRPPSWFVWSLMAREGILFGAVGVQWRMRGQLEVQPHWTGKAAAVLLMAVLASLLCGYAPADWLYGSALALSSVALMYYIWVGRGTLNLATRDGRRATGERVFPTAVQYRDR